MKRTVIDLQGRSEHHLASGRAWPIDSRLERAGPVIHLDRTWRGHPHVSSARSVIWPDRHLWILFFRGHGAPHECAAYFHMAQISDQGQQIVIDDLYLDVAVFQDGTWEVLDIDEFRAALAAGELSPEQIQVALHGLENACALVKAARGDVERYLYAML